VGKNETSLSTVYFTIPMIRVHRQCLLQNILHSLANECISRHIINSGAPRAREAEHHG